MTQYGMKPRIDAGLEFSLRGSKTVIWRGEDGLWNGWDSTSGWKIQCQGQTNAATVQENLLRAINNLNKP